MQRTGFHPAFS